MGEMGRRDFLKGGLVASAGALLTGAALTGCSSAGSSKERSAQGEQWDYETDIVVVGSGMGGFSAALRAQEKGAKVLMVEVNKWSGGGSAFCGGIICSNMNTDLDGYNKMTGHMCENEVAQAVYGAFFDGWPDWIEEQGAEVINLGKDGGWLCYMGNEEKKGVEGCRLFFDSLQEAFVNNGGELLFETCAEHIMTEGEYDKKIIGLWCKDASGNPVRIRAKAVVLSCGGFQADSELRVRYMGNDANMATIMAVPWNYGAAMKMGQEVGASFQGDMSGFAGLLTSASPARELEEDAKTFSNRGFDGNGTDSVYFCADDRIDSYPDKAILVNLDGQRFADEGCRAHLLPQEVIKQRYATGFFIFDSVGWNDFMDKGEAPTPVHTRSVREQFEEVITSEEIGGVVYEGNSVEELADAMNASGVLNHLINKTALIKTVSEYNELSAANDVASLYPVRSIGGLEGQKNLSSMTFDALTTPPFYAWPCRPAIYCCHGGLAIDADAQVLDTNKNKIVGLYATTPAAGGVMNGVYTGAVAMAGGSGYLAGGSAADAIANM